MPKAKELKDIEVTYISLVEAGANRKNIIYKSSDKSPVWEKEFNILKQNKKEGIVYGIVYSPDEVDTDGEFATAEEIKKAAYNFMKKKKVDNVDTSHSFKKEDAYVCESWILRKDDPLFPKEKEGSWAVGIKIEDEKLKKAIEDGKIKALSMAGTAKTKEVEKGDTTLKELIEGLKEIFTSVNFSVGGYSYQKEDKGESVSKEKDELKKEQQKELQEALKGAITGAIEPLQKQVEELGKNLEDVKKENEVLKTALEKSNQAIELKKKKKESDNGSILA